VIRSLSGLIKCAGLERIFSLPAEYNVAVFITNQMTADPGGNRGDGMLVYLCINGGGT
jgi:hypothetical protein